MEKRVEIADSDEIKSVGIQTLDESPILGPTPEYYIQREYDAGYVLFARGATISSKEFKKIKVQIEKLPGELVREFIEKDDGTFDGLKIIRKSTTLMEYVELDGDYAMHDVKVAVNRKATDETSKGDQKGDLQGRSKDE